MVTTIPLPSRSLSLRPLVLPVEHGGWGLLFEPIVLALLVAPSRSGALVAIAALFGFLTRHPLKLALRDTLRCGHSSRTPYCWTIAAGYLLMGAVALSLAVASDGIQLLLPLVLVTPFALAQLWYDAHNRGRELMPQMSGAIAMSSVAAAIAICGGMRVLPALGLAGIVLARSLPAILYVRSLLRAMPSWPAIAAHLTAVVAVAIYGSPFAVAAMLILLIRALWGVTHEPPRARTIGWREVAFGAMTVILVALGYARS